MSCFFILLIFWGLFTRKDHLTHHNIFKYIYFHDSYHQPAADGFLPLRAFKPSSSDSADRGRSIIRVTGPHVRQTFLNDVFTFLTEVEKIILHITIYSNIFIFMTVTHNIYQKQIKYHVFNAVTNSGKTASATPTGD
jgi:hypothetical protein